MIKLVNLQKIFRTEEVETVALSDVSLSIEEKEFVAIMGPSGCGKSTLLNVLGLLDNPTAGEYYLAGAEVGSMKESERTEMRKEIGLTRVNDSWFKLFDIQLIDGRLGDNEIDDFYSYNLIVTQSVLDLYGITDFSSVLLEPERRLWFAWGTGEDDV